LIIIIITIIIIFIVIIIERSTVQVATYLLTHGLEWCDGVVFLDDADRKMIVLRDGLKACLSVCIYI
jgi:hypothetical protein